MKTFFKKRIPVQARQVTQTEVILTAHGRVRAEPGDWILSNPRTGDMWPIKPDIFEDTYEEAPQENAEEKQANNQHSQAAH
ncbi:MAG: hypothetical protein ACWGNI_00055 [Desulfobacterales bacterium]